MFSSGQKPAHSLRVASGLLLAFGGEGSITYSDGAADEAVSVVDFKHSFKQLVSCHFVCCHLTLQQIHGL